jgi:hypothetical protein
MFLKSVTELAIDFDDVRTVIVRTPREWLDWLAAEAREEGNRLTVHVGLEVAGKHVGGPVELEVGEPADSHHVVMLPLRLRSRDHRRLFPTLEGSLEAAWLGRGQTYLALSLTYDPPLGLVGQAVDRALLHRVAETVAQRFLEAIANELLVRAECLGQGGPPDTAGAADGVAG